jgi:hypothetical protein
VFSENCRIAVSPYPYLYPYRPIRATQGQSPTVPENKARGVDRSVSLHFQRTDESRGVFLSFSLALSLQNTHTLSTLTRPPSSPSITLTTLRRREGTASQQYRGKNEQERSKAVVLGCQEVNQDDRQAGSNVMSWPDQTFYFRLLPFMYLGGLYEFLDTRNGKIEF